MRNIFFVFLVFLFFSCDNSKLSKNITPSNIIKKNKPIVNNDSNVYVVDKKSIIFYSKTQNEFDLQIKNMTDEQVMLLNENAEDFFSYYYHVKQKTLKFNIVVEELSVRYFKFIFDNKEVLFDRMSNNKLYGLILFDGEKEPLIIEDESLDLQNYYLIIEQYFNIKLE